MDFVEQQQINETSKKYAIDINKLNISHEKDMRILKNKIEQMKNELKMNELLLTEKNTQIINLQNDKDMLNKDKLFIMSIISKQKIN